MSTTPGAVTDAGANLFTAGGDNEQILETIGDEIVDSHSSTAAPGGTAIEGADSAAGVASPDAAAAVEVPEWMETAPGELKALLEHQNVSAAAKQWLKDTYGDMHSIRELPIGSKEALGEIHTMFPGGLEEIKEAHQNSATFVQEMEQFKSGDPVQQTELLSNLLTNDTADAFISLIGVGADLMRQTLRDDYSQFAGKITRSHIDEVTDGHFSKFGDSTVTIVDKYRAAAEAGNEADMNKYIGQLANAALQYGDWWKGSSRTKLGYGEQQTNQPAAERTRMGTVPKGAMDESSQDVIYARKDAGYFESNFQMAHDGLVNPIINTMLTRDLTARKMDLPDTWKSKVSDFVANGVKRALAKDPTFTALETRVYRRNAPNDPRRWDNSDKSKQVLLDAVKQRANKLIPGILKNALDELASLRGAPAAAAAATTRQPGAGVRSSATQTRAAGTAPSGDWKDGLKKGEISNEDALNKMLGL